MMKKRNRSESESGHRDTFSKGKRKQKKTVSNTLALPAKPQEGGMCLKKFLEAKYMKPCQDQEGFFSNWVQGMEYD